MGERYVPKRTALRYVRGSELAERVAVLKLNRPSVEYISPKTDAEAELFGQMMIGRAQQVRWLENRVVKN